MPEFSVTSVRSPALSEEERKRKLGQVYDLLLRLAAEKRAAEGNGTADLDGEARNQTRTAEPERR
ncbi:hypothetical protein ACFLYD_06970 [Chloroflexota bacterium]